MKEAIVLKVNSMFESDKQVELFFKKTGKHLVLAKHAQSIRSAKGRILQPFSKINASLSHNQRYIQSCELIDDRLGIRGSYQQLEQAGFVISVVRASVMMGQVNEALYQVLDAVLDCICANTFGYVEQQQFYQHYLLAEGLKLNQQSLSKEQFIKWVQHYTSINLENHLSG